MKAILINMEVENVCLFKPKKINNVKAKIAVSYDYGENNLLNLKYSIRVIDHDFDYLIIRCCYQISEYNDNLEEKTILNQAVTLLQTRIEFLLVCLSKEAGLKIQD